MTHDQLVQLAADQLRLGSRVEAESICRQILATEATHAGALNLLGIILKSSGRLDEAVAVWTRLVELQPDSFEAQHRLAMALAALKRFDEALVHHDRALSLRPSDTAAHEAKGVTLLLKQDAVAAADCLGRAAELAPSSAPTWNRLGMILRTLGRFDEASDCFRRAVAINPNVPQFHRNLISINSREATPEAIDRLLKLLNRPDLPVDDRVEAGFALGKLLDDQERFDEAFACYARANALVRQSLATAGQRYDPEQMRRAADTMIQSFTPEFFANRRDWGSKSELPVFIVGMPRSGTSLVEQIAASHPAVFGAGELNDINVISRKLARGHDRLTGQAWSRDSIAQAAAAHVEKLRALAGARTVSRVIDKVPGNVLQLGLIAVLFPAARVIFCRRDPRDTCLSCFFQQFSKQDRQLFIYDLADCARHHLQVDRLISDWLKVLPLRMIEMQYEDLVNDLERHSRRLIEFLGLAWDPACLQFHRTERSVLTSSVWQVRQPIYTRSVARWRHYQNHIQPMLDILWPDKRPPDA